MSDTLRPADHSALKVNQFPIIILSLLAFILGVFWIALGVGPVMALGSILGKPGFLPIYKGIAKPLGLVHPDIVQDNPEPHRFAQGFGAVVLPGGSAALAFGEPVLGLPTVYLFDASGAPRQVFRGLASKDKLREALSPLAAD